MEKIELKFIKHKLYLCVDSAKLNLNSDDALEIIDEKNKPYRLFFSDIDNDGTKEIIVVTGHPIFFYKGVARIFKFKNNSWDTLKFFQGGNEDYDGIITEGRITLYNSKSKKLFLFSGPYPFEKQPKYSIYLHQWSTKLHKIIVVGHKIYHKFNWKSPKKMMF